jgi:Immunity protein Imm5
MLTVAVRGVIVRVDLPSDVLRHQEIAASSMSSDELHDMPIRHVMSLLNLLGESEKVTGALSLAIKRWVFCEVLSVEKVLPIWSLATSNNSPSILVSEVLKVLSGENETMTNRLPYEESKKVQALGRMEWTVSEIHEAAALLFAHAEHAIQFGRTFRYQIDSSIDNSKIYPGDWPCVYKASIAYSHGIAWNGTGSPDLRRAFWNWWLFEAIPYSFRRFPTNEISDNEGMH